MTRELNVKITLTPHREFTEKQYEDMFGRVILDFLNEVYGIEHAAVKVQVETVEPESEEK